MRTTSLSVWKASLALFSAIFLSATFLSLTAASVSAQDDPPAQAGRLSALSGNVSVQPAGTDDWGQAYQNLPVGLGDRIFTDFDGRAEIQIGQTFLRVGPNSDVTLVDANPDAITFGVAQGAAHVRVLGLWPDQSLYIQTPSGSSTVTQPADFRVDVMPNDQTAIFTNFAGDVFVSGANDLGLDTGGGQALQLIGSNPVYPQWLEPNGYDNLDQWSENRDQQIANSMSFRYVSHEIPGAYELDASGDWMPGTDYGAVWFPRVDPGWAPYHNGHWVNHAPWGWVWVEDESWGYAPFHFGRWVNFGGRWGWIPGPPAAHPVWSPALVVFAGGVHFGGVGVSAWFPLGPGEPYRPWYPCSPRYINQVNISNISESRVVHVQTTYVNIVNVTNITYVNRTVGVTAMRQEDFASGRPAAQVSVRIDMGQMAHVQALARPEPVPTRQAMIGRPPARPVPVLAQRPNLINPQGKMVAAKPNAQPIAAPVRAAPAPKALPGRQVVAAPPGVKNQPNGKPPTTGGHPAPPPTPGGQPRPQPLPVQNSNQGGNRPAQTPGMNPTTHPEPVQPARPEPTKPAPNPGMNPTAHPEPMQPARPTPQPAPKAVPEPRPTPAPEVKPAPAPAPRPTNENKPAVIPPQSRQTPPAPKPDEKPAPPVRPAPAPGPKPAPKPAPVPPPSRPAPQPQPRPEVKPVPPPPAPKPAAKPGEKPAPDKNKKPEKEKKEEEKPQ